MTPSFQLGHVFSDMDCMGQVMAGGACNCSFNWATSFQTWIGSMAQPNWLMARTFQLGHVFSDMD